MWRLNWNDASYLSLPLRYANSINIPSSGPSQELRRDSTAFRRARSVSWTQILYSSRLYISMSWFAVSLWLWCLMQAISSISKHIKPLVVTEKSRQWHWKALYSNRWVKDRTYLMISDYQTILFIISKPLCLLDILDSAIQYGDISIGPLVAKVPVQHIF